MLSMLNYYIFYLAIQLRDFITHPGLYPLLPAFSSLFDYKSDIWNFIMSSRLENLKINTKSKGLPANLRTTTNYVFGILGESSVLKFKCEPGMELSHFKS